MKAVILCGGKGTRLQPFTRIIPKPLMPIENDMCILGLIIRQLRHHGFNDIILAVGHMGHLIKSYIGDGSRFGVKITYSKEEKPLGTAGPLALLKDIESDILVMNGDVLTDLNFSDLVKVHEIEHNHATIASYTTEITIPCGVLDPDGLGGEMVVRYKEKPIMKYQTSMGIYVLSPEGLSHIPKKTFMNISDLFNVLIEKKKQVKMYRFEGKWIDMGIIQNYEIAVKVFSEQRERFLN